MKNKIINKNLLINQAWESYHNGNYKGALNTFLMLTDEGESGLLYTVGLMHYKGLGIKENRHLALNYFKKSIKHNHKEGYYYLGRDQLRNDELFDGVKNLKKSAKLRFLPAYRFLGLLYRHGKYVNKNTSKSFYYFYQGCLNNHAICCMFVGILMMKNKKGFLNIFYGAYLYVKSFILVLRHGSKEPIDPRLDIGALTSSEDKLI